MVIVGKKLSNSGDTSGLSDDNQIRDREENEKSNNSHDQKPDSKPPKPKTHYTVLVTGQGAFAIWPDEENSSHRVSNHLPAFISPHNAKTGEVDNEDLKHKLARFNPTSLPIKILNPTAGKGNAIPTSYAITRKVIGEFWDQHSTKPDAENADEQNDPEHEEVDLFLHLGMANNWDFYSVERIAYNTGFSSTFWGNQGLGGLPENNRKPDGTLKGYYHHPDYFKRNVSDLTEEEGKDKWKAAPMGLGPGVSNVDKIVGSAMKVVNEIEVRDGKKEVEIRAHDEPGGFVCGWIYYESLAQRWSRGLEGKGGKGKKVVFMHVPGWLDEESLERGAEAVCAVIGAVCKEIEEEL